MFMAATFTRMCPPGRVQAEHFGQRGVIQVHAPEKSYEEHEALVRNAETILARNWACITERVAFDGDMGFASAEKTYDWRWWLPQA